MTERRCLAWYSKFKISSSNSLKVQPLCNPHAFCFFAQKSEAKAKINMLFIFYWLEVNVRSVHKAIHKMGRCSSGLLHPLLQFVQAAVPTVKVFTIVPTALRSAEGWWEERFSVPRRCKVGLQDLWDDYHCEIQPKHKQKRKKLCKRYANMINMCICLYSYIYNVYTIYHCFSIFIQSTGCGSYFLQLQRRGQVFPVLCWRRDVHNPQHLPTL